MPAVAQFLDISHEEVFVRLTQSPAGTIAVVTPNQRLSLALQREFGERQAASGKVLWESADILPWSGFLERASQETRYTDVAPLPLLLAPAQSHALWENLLRNSPNGEALLAVADAARLAHEAWQLTITWRLQARLRSATLNEDSKALLEWAPRYERALQRNGLMDAVDLADRLLPLLAGGRIKTPRMLIAYGFDSFTPQQADFLAGLQQTGCKVLLASPSAITSRVLRLPCADAQQEILRAAAWARTRLEAGHTRIGVVVPDLAARRAAVVRIFSATMAPDYALPGAAVRVLPFNLSLGESLAVYPLVNTALLLLELTGRDIEFERASRVLRSPFIAGGEAERSCRALLDAELRRHAEPSVTLERLRSMVVQHDCPQLARRLTVLAEFRRNRLFGAQAPSLWARAFSEALAISGFPGERTLDSAEYQTLKRWHDLVAGFAALDRVVPRMGYAEALARLRRMAGDTLFQPESPEVPIQILGVLETSGLTFDCLWVMGLGDGNWPPPQRPNPFLPLAVQRAAGMPQSSPAAALAVARGVTARWRAAAAEVVLSHPLQEDDRELRPGSLIADVPAAEPDIVTYPDYRAAIHALRIMESLADDAAPPLEDDGQVAGGGSGLLKNQAACPFRACALHRLHAVAPEAPHAGLDALERGTLIHNVLAKVWSRLRASAALQAMASEELDALLDSAADSAMERIRRDRPTALSGRFAEIEKRRLIGLTRAWLEVDRRRGAFAVLAVEDKRSMSIGGLQLNVRLDRVDETTDGRRIVIDYKTGTANAGAMLGERPEEPQLPLYLVTAEPDAAAVAFAQVRTGNMAYVGLARDGDLLPGVKAYAESRHNDQYPQWPDLVAAWRADLEQIARQFAAGISTVDPKHYPQTCQFCDLQPFCRIRERLGEPIAGGETGE
ncbi:MAG: PD-(D/E)XK nuclease family protein [Burkholderiales bacterium]|nr:PD-(D/E)XK nuclease family protein [Burkholderiales bacterium]